MNKKVRLTKYPKIKLGNAVINATFKCGKCGAVFNRIIPINKTFYDFHTYLSMNIVCDCGAQGQVSIGDYGYV
jgi:hypothetical protein